MPQFNKKYKKTALSIDVYIGTFVQTEIVSIDIAKYHTADIKPD